MAAATLAACGGGGTDPTVDRGQALFERHCAVCHGMDLSGTGLGPALTHDFYAEPRFTDEQMATAIRDGVQPNRWSFGPMPGVPGLSAEDADRLIAYVRQRQAELGTGG